VRRFVSIILLAAARAVLLSAQGASSQATLFLSQVRERLGAAALANTGY
jgi:hypothetical protein